MLIRLLVVAFTVVYAADGSGSQTYNGYGKGYGDYIPPTKGYGSYTSKRSTYAPHSGTSFSFRPRSSPSYGYNRHAATKPRSSRFHEPESSLTSVYKGNYGSSRPGSYSKPHFRSSPNAFPVYTDSYGNFDYSLQDSLNGRRAKSYETPYDASAPGRSPSLSYFPKSSSDSYFPKSASTSYFPKSSSTSNFPKSSSASYFPKSSSVSYFPKSSSTSYFPKASFPSSSSASSSYFPRSSYEDISGSKYDGRSSLGLRRTRPGAKSFTVEKSEPQDSFKFYGKSDSRYRSRDPCVSLKEGEYVLDRRFHSLFSYVDPQCYFVKCANKKAYLNPCSTASRNNKGGEGFCNIIDLEGFCGPSFHDVHLKKDTKE